MRRIKLWEGRFSKSTAQIFDLFNASIMTDIKLFEYDILGSVAHVKMLAKCNIILEDEAKLIIDSLYQILEDFKSGKIEFEISDEDVHMLIEKELIKRIGEVGKKVHTARSRNDQVALDERLFCREKNLYLQELIKTLINTIVNLAEENIDVIMPGFTHLQKAQPILFSHYILAYAQMLKRDLLRLRQNYSMTNYSPLGSAALAGTTFEIDRFFVASELGFESVTENSIDTVSDRDFILEMLFLLAMIQMHLSRLAEDFIIFNTDEFKFIELDDSFCSGSSIMPQKKNPDALELIRGKTGRVYANLIGLLTVLKGLPLSYNKDLQEDKEFLFDSIETVEMSLVIINEILKTLKINKENMERSCKSGFINATDLADYLVTKGIAFRDAHFIVGNIVKYCIESGKTLEDLSLEEYKRFSEKIQEDVCQFIKIETCVNRRKSYGGTSLESVRKQIDNLKEFLNKLK
ncbi:argininosuccinate lyase [Caldicellulosiruptor hydrothermalis 108]|uniref:Argininosuccinate lyase n=1 Tax=Caldicellulosiruptor hydrothermalis (strain DSM 18901 / VKM B-2411 / 108) TaxID=632292 RepID=E4QBA1_CALH1|nr:argininosuccinate lyase [Caldicellulosiruptor hydrothermalis]ADQ07194.1 argininosuccinate lyase [Caldicellulosiruptor hydrothermalis 108]